MCKSRFASLIFLPTVMALLALAPSAVASSCGWRVESFPVNVTTSDPGVTFFVFPLSPPVAMDPVSVVNQDFFRLTKTGSGFACALLQLMSEGNAIASLGGVCVTSGAAPISIIDRSGSLVNESALVDAIRLRIEQSNAGMTTTVQGMHAGDEIIVRFVVAPFAPDGPHERLDLGVLPPYMLEGGETSEWTTVLIDPPVLATDLRRVGQSGGSFNFSGGLGSATVETQLIFDNQVILTLDDWASPSQHQAPEDFEHLFNMTGSLAIDAETAAQIEGANLIRWRQRAHATGPVTVTITPAGGANFLLELTFDSVVSVEGDLDRDCIVGITDLLMLLAAWGPCPDPCPPFCLGDIDGDCNVGVTDLLLLLANWG